MKYLLHHENKGDEKDKKINWKGCFRDNLKYEEKKLTPERIIDAWSVLVNEYYPKNKLKCNYNTEEIPLFFKLQSNVIGIKHIQEEQLKPEVVKILLKDNHDIDSNKEIIFVPQNTQIEFKQFQNLLKKQVKKELENIFEEKFEEYMKCEFEKEFKKHYSIDLKNDDFLKDIIPENEDQNAIDELLEICKKKPKKFKTKKEYLDWVDEGN